MLYPAASQLSPAARRLFKLSIGLSIFVHFLLVLSAGFLPKMKPFLSEEKTPIEVQLVEKLPTQETLQETAKEPPESADFASTRNLKAEKETSPDQSSSNVLSKAPTQQQTKKPKKRSFELSKKDLMAMNDPLLSDAPQVLDRFSPGFLERLERGEELKINAFGFDYGQYLERMKRKIAQRWRPRQTITPQMYDYSEITVQLAVVLNDRGELVNLAVIESSFFPNYDDEAVRAFEQAVPFPNPPESLIQDDRRVYIPWFFRMSFSNRSAGVY